MNKPLIATVGLFEKPVQKKKGKVDDGEKQDARVTSSAELVAKLKNAQKVMIVPGYGLAVSKGQYTLASLIESLRKDGISHPSYHPSIPPRRVTSRPRSS
jgi:NAD/NADP transhydrogenase beta subunit